MKLSQRHKDALRMQMSRKEFPAFVDFLKVQRNNIGLLQWARVKADDPQIAIKKARYEGQVEIIKLLLKAYEEIKITKDE